MTPATSQLLSAISSQGNALWSGKLSKTDKGEYIYPRERLPFASSWVRWWLKRTADDQGNMTALGVFFVLFVPVDLLQMFSRVCLFPLVWTVWWCERQLGGLLRYNFFCPLCQNWMADAFVRCGKCGRVQGMLAPSLSGLFLQPCGGEDCGESVGTTLGNYLGRRPKNLICRDGFYIKGCYHPLPFSFLKSAVASTHTVIFATTVSVKHALLTNLVAHALQDSHGSYRIPWNLNQQEWLLLQQVFGGNNPQPELSIEEMPPHYSLAKTFLLQRATRKLLVLHNLPQGWLAAKDPSRIEAISWGNVQRLLFVIDADKIADEGLRQQLSNAEAFARIVRAVERYLDLCPGDVLPFSIAVILAVSDGARKKYGLSHASEMSEQEVEQFVTLHSPATVALLRRTVPSGRLSWFGGTLPQALDTTRTFWLQSVVRWLD